MKRYTRGFTLIELLVVIAIIGILASVVLVSLQSARRKGNDSRVISDVQQLRTQLESDNNPTTNYGTGFTAVDTLSAAGNYSVLSTDASTQGGAITVKNDGAYKSYAIYGRLPSSPSGAYRYFCIDSTGFTNPSVITPATGTNYTCPTAGN